MSEEIKELIDYIDDRVIPNEKWKQIRDYTNDLIKENQQLKEDIEQGDELIKHWIKEAEKLNDKNFRLEQCLNTSNNKLNKYIKVLDEIREYIIKYTETDEVTKFRYLDLSGNDIDYLLQILDKVKE